MNPAERVEKLVNKWQNANSLSSEEKMYATGLAEKWHQVLYTLNRIQNLDTSDSLPYASTTGTADSSEELLDSDAKIRYYCDALWTCLYSTLDILAQLVNIVTGRNLSEDVVDFSQMVNHLNQTEQGTLLRERLDKVKNRCRAYKYLNNYRNCATHRRPIYIQTLTIQARGTPGYPTATATFPGTVLKRVICDDPLALTPTVKKDRQVVQFCRWVSYQIAEQLDKVLMALDQRK